MEKIILIIEDKPEEVEKAKRAVIANGCKPVLAKNLENAKFIFKSLRDIIFGVVTDLHFSSMENNDRDIDKPNGLAIVAFCVDIGIRVAVCSDIDHHFSQYLREPVRVLSTHQNYKYDKVPFSEDSKNWDKIIKQLLNLKEVTN